MSLRYNDQTSNGFLIVSIITETRVALFNDSDDAFVNQSPGSVLKCSETICKIHWKITMLAHFQ